MSPLTIRNFWAMTLHPSPAKKAAFFAAIFRRLSAIRIRRRSCWNLRKKPARCCALPGRDFVGRREGNVWHYLGRRRLYNLPTPAMRGEHQIANAATALAVLESMPDSLWPGIGAVRQGLHGGGGGGAGADFSRGSRWWWRMLRIIRRRR